MILTELPEMGKGIVGSEKVIVSDLAALKGMRLLRQEAEGRIEEIVDNLRK